MDPRGGLGERGTGGQGDQTLRPLLAKFKINHVHLHAATVEIQYCSSLGAGTGLFIGAILLVSVVLIQPIPIIFCAAV
jgi:hypothetical protein